jgi:dTDP-4-dehydrorhamnose reductase
MSSYSFGQTVTAASESADGRSSSLAAGHSDGRHIQVPTQVRQTAIQVPVHTRSYHPELVRRKNEPLRILVSGATGLLGRQVLHALQGFNVRGLCRSRCKATQLVSCDLTAEGEATRQIEDFNPHIVIHLAGERRSDVIRRSPARSRLLNVDASGALAAACEFCGAWLIFISSDAVFDGSSSPYAEDDSPNPVSEYGWHKLHAEKIVLAACPRAAVLRLPLLYGPVEFAAESVVTEIYSELRIGMQELDHYQRHYPTWACDVAEVIRAMVDMHTSGKEVRGIFHWQGGEQFTKYDIGMIIASACGFPAPRPILRDSNAGADAIAHDARLDCSRLQGLLSTSGISLSFTPLREGLRSCLEVFHDARLDTSKSACKVEASPHVAPTHVDEALRQAVVDPSQTRPPTHETTREMQNNSSFQDTVSQNVIDSSTPHGTRYVPVERASAPESSSLRESTETSEQRDKKEQSRLQSLSLRSEDGHAARAAALKNVFREELELAWRRYRDAAYEENGSETSHKLFGNDEHRGVLV